MTRCSFAFRHGVDDDLGNGEYCLQSYGVSAAHLSAGNASTKSDDLAKLLVALVNATQTK